MKDVTMKWGDMPFEHHEEIAASVSEAVNVDTVVGAKQLACALARLGAAERRYNIRRWAAARGGRDAG